MKTRLILLTCSLLLTTGVARDVLAQSSTAPQLPEWKTYTVKDGGFAISMPVLPAVQLEYNLSLY